MSRAGGQAMRRKPRVWKRWMIELNSVEECAIGCIVYDKKPEVYPPDKLIRVTITEEAK